jgi:hypothetical protein
MLISLVLGLIYLCNFYCLLCIDAILAILPVWLLGMDVLVKLLITGCKDVLTVVIRSKSMHFKVGIIFKDYFTK